MIRKQLSANDTGETGGHQAGILVPKDRRVLSYFPDLDETVRNPRAHLTFLDDAGGRWLFAFIYYNNRFFGGTRDEYRLTRMTRYMRESGLTAGDQVVFSKGEDAVRRISYLRARNCVQDEEGILRLGSGWTVVSYGREKL
jgi:hypothetical protein